LFSFLSNTIQGREQLTFIFTGTFALLDMMRNREDISKICMPIRISYLDEKSAQQLVVEPILSNVTEKGKLQLDERVVEKIIYVTNSHPFLIQYLCISLINRINQNGSSSINIYDINEVIREIISQRIHDMPFIVFWNEFANYPEAKLLSIIAGHSSDNDPNVDLNTIIAAFKDNNEEIKPEMIIQFGAVLEDADLLSKSVSGSTWEYAIKIPLYRMWLKINKPIKLVI